MYQNTKELKGWLGIAGMAAAAYIGVKYVLPKLDPPNYLVAEDNSENGMYAFVTNPLGTLMFAKTDPAAEPMYGHGREPLLANKLDNGTYVGKLTGITFHELAQVRTNIDGKDYAFWVKSEDIRTSEKDEMDLSNQIKKTQSDLQNIVTSLAGNLKL